VENLRIRFALAVVLCLFLLNPALAEVEESYFGKRVSKISYLTSSNLGWDDLTATTGLKLGKILTKESFARARQALSSRGVFSKVEGELGPHPSGVLVKFILHPRASISRVYFEGVSGIEKTRLESLAATLKGEPLQDERLEKFSSSLDALLSREGYRDYEIKLEVDSSPESHYAELTAVVEGKIRQKISSITFPEQIPEEITSRLDAVTRQFIDDSVSSYNLDLLRQGLLVACREEGYLQANIESLDIVEITKESSEIRITLLPGEPISIVFRGNEQFSAEELLAPLEIETRKVPFAPTAVKSLDRKIVALYQKAGFFRASTSMSALPARGLRKVYEITIEEGKAYQSLPIEFSGNKNFDSEELSVFFKSLTIPGLLGSLFQSPSVSEEALSDELQKMLEYYRSQGFFSVKGTLSYEIAGNQVRPRVTLVEGERFSFEGVRIDLAELEHASLLDAEVLPLLAIESEVKAGDSYNAELVENERRRILNVVHELGYPVAQVKAALDLEAGHLVYQIKPGIMVRVGKLSIAGNLHTQDQVINRSLRIREGEPWTRAKVKESRKALFKLGHFRKVSLEPVDDSFDSPVEDLVVRVAERETGRFSVGGGFHSEDGLRLLGEIRQGNLFGNGNSARIGFDAYINEGPRVIDAGNARALYRVPNLAGSDLELLVEGFFRFQIQLIDQFSYDRSGGSVGISWPVTERFTLRTGLEAYYEEVFDVLEDVVISDSDEGSAFFSFANLELDYDFRNEQFNPSQGGRSQLVLGFSEKALGSELTFGRIAVKQSLFFELWRSVVLALNARGELLIPLEQGETIPLSQRIFLGGRNSLRGFRLSSVGPRGFNNNAVGGDRSLVLNAELQFDLTEKLSGAAFLDVGQAFLSNRGEFRGEETDIEDLRYSPGLAFRYKTPIGPISLDYGIALDKKEGEDFGRFNVGIGLIF